MKKETGRILTAISLLVLSLLLWWAGKHLDPYMCRILNLIAINAIWAVSLNLIYGYTGQFSLGHAGFIAIGAYVSSLLTVSPLKKARFFMIEPPIWPISVIQWPFAPSLIVAVLIATFFGFLIGFPALQLHGDYMAIVTLGFAEVIRVFIMNLYPITNGAMGIKAVPPYTTPLWSWGLLVFAIFIVKKLGDSSYGRAFKAIREDEIAAETTGISIFHHKLIAFTIASLLAGLGGALWAHLICSTDPNAFTFLLSYQVLVITVMGGMGSLTGSVIGSTIYVALAELLRPLDTPTTKIPVLGMTIQGHPGIRMLVISILFVLIILFYRRGIMGSNELSWQWLYSKLRPIFKRKGAEQEK
ncbi:MAG: branched-chain amino acid ABC transporter permease [Chloroflexota bacterium]|nr:branched-chain amino acid ABC transporter permease [Chloroflexota bacterium]